MKIKDYQENIDGIVKTFRFIKNADFGYKVVVFSNDRSELEFKISLQPVFGHDEILPTYQLLPANQDIPKRIIDILPKLSEWIKANIDDHGLNVKLTEQL